MGSWFLVCYTATQLANQLQQTHGTLASNFTKWGGFCIHGFSTLNFPLEKPIVERFLCFLLDDWCTTRLWGLKLLLGWLGVVLCWYPCVYTNLFLLLLCVKSVCECLCLFLCACARCHVMSVLCVWQARSERLGVDSARSQWCWVATTRRRSRATRARCAHKRMSELASVIPLHPLLCHFPRGWFHLQTFLSLCL